MIGELQTFSGDLMAWFFTSFFCSLLLVGIDLEPFL